MDNEARFNEFLEGWGLTVDDLNFRRRPSRVATSHLRVMGLVRWLRRARRAMERRVYRILTALLVDRRLLLHVY